MVQLNAPAPDFEAVTTLGLPFKLSSHRGRPVALFFFPKAFTPGCTREAAQFRDAYAEMQAMGAEIVGISTDDHQTQCEFAKKMETPFPMIGDDDGHIARLFDVFWPLIRRVRRVTFLIDPQGIVRGVFQNEIFISTHRDEVLAALQRMKRAELATNTSV